MNGGPYRRIYPTKESLLFDGGLNNKFERSIIAENESPDCLNVKFSAGSVETRLGTAKLNTASVGSFVGDGMYVRKGRDGVETMVAAWGGSIWQLGTTSFTTIASSQSLFTAGVRFAASQAENYLFLGNGGSIPYKWGGTHFTRHGVYPPTVTATVVSNGVGALTASGQYQYKFTMVNSALVESDVGPATTTFVISTTSGQNRVSSIPTAPVSHGVNARRVYRNASGSTVFKLAGTISDNTTTTFDDNVADSALGATAPTDNGVPPKYNSIDFHPGLNRLFMNDVDNPDHIWWTEADSPYTVPSSNFHIVGDNTSDLCRAVKVYNNMVFGLCDNSITVGYMPDNTPANWSWQTLKIPYGCKSPFGCFVYQDKLFFPAVQNGKLAGFAVVKGGTTEPSISFLTVANAGSELKSDRIEPEVFNLVETYLANISAIVYKNCGYIAVTYGSGATTNNRYYTYDFSISNVTRKQPEAWCPNTGPHPAQFAIYGGNLYYQSADATGFAYKMEQTAYNDDGAAINSYLWTKEFTGFPDDTNFYKDWRYANVLIENAGAYYMDITYRVDSDTGGGDTKQVSLNPGGSLWGFMRWGLDAWGGGTVQREYRQSFGASRGKRIQLKFSNQNKVNQKFKVYRMNFAYNLKGFR
jgi:hypothetical protein